MIETGKGLKFQAERPHLVSLGSGRLSTAITLLPLPEGRTTLGHGPMDISIQGPGVAAQHCYIENRSGVITLHPCGNLCSVDGLQVTQPVRLSQGSPPLLLLLSSSSSPLLLLSGGLSLSLCLSEPAVSHRSSDTVRRRRYYGKSVETMGRDYRHCSE
ncbi:Pleckstrin-like proteiny-like domain family B member 1 [Nibea albiflora]|uniref:Pleckstrin-like proteiny-like domain family B member 1 n=1 Tax=Nibea albiflora TaxID=240163 RepID=A0ACB7EJA0_NIBAL|nr:Pleckstrin-like proteiny-like domain family B member 1 [Nibea albiflora]